MKLKRYKPSRLEHALKKNIKKRKKFQKKMKKNKNNDSSI